MTPVNVVPPPVPPQINNGGMTSVVVVINGRADCPKCGAKYITRIEGVQLAMGLTKIEQKEQSRIIVPNVAMPRNLK